MNFNILDPNKIFEQWKIKLLNVFLGLEKGDNFIFTPLLPIFYGS